MKTLNLSQKLIKTMFSMALLALSLLAFQSKLNAQVNLPGTYDFTACIGDVIEFQLQAPQAPDLPPVPGCLGGGSFLTSPPGPTSPPMDLGTIDEEGLWTIPVVAAGFVTYDINSNFTSCNGVWTINIALDETGCEPIEPTEPANINLEVCEGETVEGVIGLPFGGCPGPAGPAGGVTIEPSETAVSTYINAGSAGIDFTPTESTFYTVTYNGFDCATPITLITTFFVEVTDCGSTGNCVVTDPLSVPLIQNIVNDPTSTAACFYISSIIQFEYEGSTYFRTNAGANSYDETGAPCPAPDIADNIYDCEGNYICGIGFAPPATDPELCTALNLASGSGTIIWENTNVPVTPPGSTSPGVYEVTACPGEVLEFTLHLPQGAGQTTVPSCIDDGELTATIGEQAPLNTGSVDENGVWSILVNEEGFVFYNLNLQGPGSTDNCVGYWSINIIISDDCVGPTEPTEPVNTNLEVCQGESVTGTFELLNTSVDGCGPPGPVGEVVIEPSNGAVITTPLTAFAQIEFSPTESTVYTVTQSGVICGNLITTSATFTVEVNDCVGPTEPVNINLEVCEGETVEGVIGLPFGGCPGPAGPAGSVTIEPSETAVSTYINAGSAGIDFSPTESTLYTVTYNGFNCATPITLVTTFFVEVTDCGMPTCSEPIADIEAFLNGLGDLGPGAPPIDLNNLTVSEILYEGLYYYTLNGNCSGPEPTVPVVTVDCQGNLQVDNVPNFGAVTVYSECEGTSETSQVFTDYPWLTINNIVNPNNCDGETVTVYNSGAYNFIFVETNGGGTLYFQDGTYYCADAANFSCVNAYGLLSIEAVWTCGESGGADCVNPVADIQVFLNGLGDLGPGAPTIDLNSLTVSEIFYDGAYYYTLNGNCGPEPTVPVVTVDCQGVLQTDNVPNFGAVTVYENCSGSEGNPQIFTDYSWLTNVVDPNDCAGTTIDVYTQGIYSFICIQEPSGNTFYFQDGTFYCADSPGFSCVQAYGLTNMTDTWNCGDVIIQPTGDAIFEDYAWLNNLVSEDDCTDETISVYTTGAYDFILIESAGTSTLYFQDGTFYCADSPNYSCVAAYGLTNMIATWTCGDTGSGSGSDFGEYTWLNNVILDDDCSANTEVLVYTDGIYSFVYVVADDGLGRLYFQDGTFYCADSPNYSCVAAYGLTTMDLQVLWVCGIDKTGEDIREEGPSSNIDKASLSLKVFPNPSNGRAYVEVDNSIESEQIITVYDLSGRTIQQFSIYPYGFDTQIELDLSDVPTGIYLVELKTEFASEIKRLVIK